MSGKNKTVNTQSIASFIKRYEQAIVARSKDIRLSIDEAGLLVSSLTLLLNNKLDGIKEEHKPKKEETIVVNLDAGSFKK